MAVGNPARHAGIAEKRVAGVRRFARSGRTRVDVGAFVAPIRVCEGVRDAGRDEDCERGES